MRSIPKVVNALRIGSTVLLTGSLAFSTSAFAEDASSASGRQIEEVVVTLQNAKNRPSRIHQSLSAPSLRT
ncbi:MAG: hypothetical protein CM15mP120_19680 [Pseudomonadota bacterium]|nr:MAG: hypothetical protein CM15mP120_19680 [Pseudomonadota bacterium]